MNSMQPPFFRMLPLQAGMLQAGMESSTMGSKYEQGHVLVCSCTYIHCTPLNIFYTLYSLTSNAKKSHPLCFIN
ncbi:hypothetical protein X975_14000, partial [Stegodyphus mimosarum]